MAIARCSWLVFSGLGLLLLAPGCAEAPGAAHIVGPDGTRMLHVHCASNQVACFEIAGERCPHGYDLSPIFDPHDGNFLVRCRNPQAPPAVLASSPATSPSKNPAAAVSDRWPPAEVARPSEPWPAHVSNELAPAPRIESGAVDLGY
jgi:hypothetical protein